MSLNRHPKYPDVWVARIYVDGRRKDPKTGKPSNKRETHLFEGREAEAEAWYQELLRTPAKAQSAPIAPTLDQAWPEFCRHYKNKVAPGTFEDVLLVWKRKLSPFFGRLRPHQLTPGLIESYKSHRLQEPYLPGKPAQLPSQDTPEERKRRKTPKPRTINRELSYLSAVTSWMGRPEINLAKPLGFKIQGFPRKLTAPPKPVIPTRAEIIMLLRRAEPEYRSIFAFCYYTGARKSEALQLQASAINWSQGYLIIKGKGDKERIVPIFRKLRVYLRRRHRITGYVWTNAKTGEPYRDIKKALARAAQKAGLNQHVYAHLLRHSFGTHSIQSGVGLRSLQMMMGHASSSTTEGYTTLANQFLAHEMEKFGSGALSRRKRVKPVGNKHG